jgi:hypothetical protein
LNDIDLDKIDLASLKKLAEAASAKFNSRKKDELKHMVAGWLAEPGAPADRQPRVVTATARVWPVETLDCMSMPLNCFLNKMDC